MDKEFGLTLLQLIVYPIWNVCLTFHPSPRTLSTSLGGSLLLSQMVLVLWSFIYLKQETNTWMGKNHWILILLEILPGVMAFRTPSLILVMKLALVHGSRDSHSKDKIDGIGSSCSSPEAPSLVGTLNWEKYTNKLLSLKKEGDLSACMTSASPLWMALKVPLKHSTGCHSTAVDGNTSARYKQTQLGNLSSGMPAAIEHWY